MKKLIILLLFYLLFTTNAAWSHSVSDKASAFIITPNDGARLTSPFRVTFGIKHFKIAPAGENIHKAGHFHLLIDLDTPISLDDPIPYTQHHRHFDKGETEVLLSLPPGQHSLQLVVGDEEHEPFEQLISEKIIIEVLK